VKVYTGVWIAWQRENFLKPGMMVPRAGIGYNQKICARFQHAWKGGSASNQVCLGLESTRFGAPQWNELKGCQLLALFSQA
jgi:hypothetical protein